jgi:uncharacterized membrane protein YkvA (DUF1232 family)
MADAQEKRNLLGPYIPQGNVIREVVQQVKLAYNLVLDARVPWLTKLIPVAALAYLFMPIDVLPDLALGLGQLDDLAILMLGLRTFFEFSPPEVVHEHLRRLVEGARWDVTAAPPAAGDKPKPDDEVVEGTFHEGQS